VSDGGAERCEWCSNVDDGAVEVEGTKICWPCMTEKREKAKREGGRALSAWHKLRAAWVKAALAAGLTPPRDAT